MYLCTYYFTLLLVVKHHLLLILFCLFAGHECREQPKSSSDFLSTYFDDFFPSPPFNTKANASSQSTSSERFSSNQLLLHSRHCRQMGLWLALHWCLSRSKRIPEAQSRLLIQALSRDIKRKWDGARSRIAALLTPIYDKTSKSPSKYNSDSASWTTAQCWKMTTKRPHFRLFLMRPFYLHTFSTL